MNPYYTINHNNKANYINMQNMPMQVSCIDHYFISVLMTMLGKKLVVETVRGSLTGNLIDVKPDHIVLGEAYDETKFYILISQIVHIMPTENASKHPQYKY